VRSLEAPGFGFDEEPSTTGMAAFPGGPFRREARRIARCEAIERWALCEWWDGHLPVRPLPGGIGRDSGEVEILQPHDDVRVVLVWKRERTTGMMTYGFACDALVSSSLLRAEGERRRTEQGLRNLAKTAKQPETEFEVRALFFGEDEGFRLFVQQLNKSLACSRIRESPKLIVDREVIGPWARYTTVWRCLFSMSQNRNRPDFFLF
jgi:hypothetical protein